ncbi:MAG: hypothetical protein Q8P59_09465 [Dehalococcoidia bacterium]|nr:hypothetical protein [Dehalococcoidia bacterium]
MKRRPRSWSLRRLDPTTTVAVSTRPSKYALLAIHLTEKPCWMPVAMYGSIVQLAAMPLVGEGRCLIGEGQHFQNQGVGFLSTI